MSTESIRGGWRVKLYELESSGTWVDHGIGFAYIQLNSTFNGPALSVISETNPDQFLLQSKIQSEDLYEKQGETIILWKEADFSGNIDYALSFQEAEGCSFIWNAINEVQSEYMQQREYGSVPSFARTQRILRQSQNVGSSSENFPTGSPSLYSSHNSNQPQHQNDGGSSSTFTIVDESHNGNLYTILPSEFQANESFLNQVKAKLESLHPAQRDYVSAQLLHENCSYLKSLFKIFDEFEQRQQRRELAIISDIFRFVLLLNDPSIIEYLLSHDDVFRAVAGIFEYDKALKTKGQYRQFLFEVSQMKEVIFLSEEVKLASKFLYRLKYVRDIMLHPTIDDPGITAINSMITFTSGEICSKVMNDEAYMTELFSVIYPNIYQSLLANTQAAVAPSPALQQDCIRWDQLTNKNTLMSEERQQYYQQLYLQQLQRLGSSLASSSSSADASADINIQRKRRITKTEQLPNSFHGVLFLKELINLSKFMSYDRRVDLYKTFFSKYKDIFLKVILFVFNGATRALHFQINKVTPESSVSMVIAPSDSQAANDRSFAIVIPGSLNNSRQSNILSICSVSAERIQSSVNESLPISIENAEASELSLNIDESFEQETVKDNITERLESCSQPSMPEVLDGEIEGAEVEEDTDDQKQLDSFGYEELFSYSQSLEVLNYLADILSTIAFTFPSLLRQAIVDGVHPPVFRAQSSDLPAASTAPSIRTGSSPQQSDWMQSCLLFLIIDNIVNGKEITSIELFGETLKAILDFDKQLINNSPPPNNNASNHLNPLHHPPSNNANAVLINQIKIEKEKFLPYFYDFYLSYLLIPYLENNVPNASVPNEYYQQRCIYHLQSIWLSECAIRYVRASETSLLAPGSIASSTVERERARIKKIFFSPAGSGAYPLNPAFPAQQDSSSRCFSYEPAPRQSSFAVITSRRLIIEILTICVLTHSYRIKYFLMKGNHINRIIVKSLCSTSQSDKIISALPASSNHSITSDLRLKSLQLHAIKFLKAILMTKDEFYYRHLEKMDCFKSVLIMLRASPSKDNLLASSIYDLIEYIRNENISILIFYLMKKYGATFDELVIYPSVESFDKLKIKYLQLKEHEENPSLFEEQESDTRNDENGSHYVAPTSSLQLPSYSISNLRTRKRLLSSKDNKQGKFKKMAEADDEEQYFEENDESDDEDEVVVPFEEDAFFSGQQELSALKHVSEGSHQPVGFASHSSLDLNGDEVQYSANKKMRVASPHSLLAEIETNASSNRSSSPSAASSPLKYKTTFPSKPLSPPHYSQRKHGSPLDGETGSPTYRSTHLTSSSSSIHISTGLNTDHSVYSTIDTFDSANLPPPEHVWNNNSANAAGTDVFSLLSIYNDSVVDHASELKECEEGSDNGIRRFEECDNSDKIQQFKNDNEKEYLEGADLILPRLRSKFETEEVVAAVFSSNTASSTRSLLKEHSSRHKRPQVSFTVNFQKTQK